MDSAEAIIAALQLAPLPGEGGYYRETYRSELEIPPADLPASYGAARNASTAIFYLLTADTFSALHRLPGDEVFHFYLGDPVEMLQLHPDGTGELLRIGNDIAQGQRPQVVAPGGSWQGARLATGGAFALMGTTVAPGFEFADYEGADRRELLASYPTFAGLIEALTAE